MEQICLKCGAKTNYDGDLHCRRIFIDEISKLLSLGELEKAKELYFLTSFDNKWKENFLYSKGGKLKKLILDEENKREEELLKIKERRTPNCYSCKKPLDNLSNIECSKCGWIKCSCGACGCGYNSQDFTDIL